jgi:putative hydrolase of the HAD superfamily
LAGPIPPLRAVLFDGAGTLLHLSEPVSRVYRRAAQRHGIARPPEDLDDRARDAMRRLRTAPPEGVPLSRVPEIEKEGWRAVVRAVLGPDSGDGPVFEMLWGYYGTTAAWSVASGAAEALDRLRALGLRTGLVSNMDARLPRLLDAFDLARRLDVVAIPSTVGLAKPDRRAFHAALTRLNVPPLQALYIGDQEADCVEAARRAGLRSIRYDPHADPRRSDVIVSFRDLAGRILGELS